MGALLLVATGLMVIFLGVQLLDVLKVLLHSGPEGWSWAVVFLGLELGFVLRGEFLWRDAGTREGQGEWFRVGD